MAPDIAARAAEPFFTTKPRGSGTGLGLATAHGFAEQSGGALLIESRSGIGTKVSIVLPRAPFLDEEPVSQIDPNLHGRAVILLVDDDEQVRPLTASFLRDLGYTIIEAPTAEIAFALAHAPEALDLVITDVVMPGADGRSWPRGCAGSAPICRSFSSPVMPRRASSKASGFCKNRSDMWTSPTISCKCLAVCRPKRSINSSMSSAA